MDFCLKHAFPVFEEIGNLATDYPLCVRASGLPTRGWVWVITLSTPPSAVCHSEAQSFQPLLKSGESWLETASCNNYVFSFLSELQTTFHSRIFPDWLANQPIRQSPAPYPFKEDFCLMRYECFSFQQLFFSLSLSLIAAL